MCEVHPPFPVHAISLHLTGFDAMPTGLCALPPSSFFGFHPLPQGPWPWLPIPWLAFRRVQTFPLRPPPYPLVRKIFVWQNQPRLGCHFSCFISVVFQVVSKGHRLCVRLPLSPFPKR